MLGVVQGLHHRQQGRPCISLLIHACQIVVQLNDTLVKPSGRQEPHRHEYINNISKEKQHTECQRHHLLVHFSDLIHHPLEPLE